MRKQKSITHYIITPWPCSVHVWASSKENAIKRYLLFKPYFVKIKEKRYQYVIKERKASKYKRLRL